MSDARGCRWPTGAGSGLERTAPGVGAAGLSSGGFCAQAVPMAAARTAGTTAHALPPVRCRFKEPDKTRSVFRTPFVGRSYLRGDSAAIATVIARESPRGLFTKGRIATQPSRSATEPAKVALAPSREPLAASRHLEFIIFGNILCRVQHSSTAKSRRLLEGIEEYVVNFTSCTRGGSKTTAPGLADLRDSDQLTH